VFFYVLAVVHPSIFIKNNRRVMYSEGSSALEEKQRGMFSEGDAVHPVGCDSPLKIVMAV
jgi:hypothetical protein